MVAREIELAILSSPGVQGNSGDDVRFDERDAGERGCLFNLSEQAPSGRMECRTSVGEWTLERELPRRPHVVIAAHAARTKSFEQDALSRGRFCVDLNFEMRMCCGCGCRHRVEFRRAREELARPASVRMGGKVEICKQMLLRGRYFYIEGIFIEAKHQVGEWSAVSNKRRSSDGRRSERRTRAPHEKEIRVRRSGYYVPVIRATRGPSFLAELAWQGSNAVRRSAYPVQAQRKCYLNVWVTETSDSSATGGMTKRMGPDGTQTSGTRLSRRLSSLNASLVGLNINSGTRHCPHQMYYGRQRSLTWVASAKKKNDLKPHAVGPLGER
ncbi:hypothetical protein C8R45DRAFT_930141 [Mycena sanguinolenta]|nr:hypothetical protein C8R45DRAFT_930141 [Mycena sanguinolenta]